MNKRQLIARVQQYMGPGTGRETATAAVDAVLGSILQACQKSPTHLMGFGTFAIRQSPARLGYDMNSGTTQIWPESRRLTFHPAEGLVRKVNPS